MWSPLKKLLAGEGQLGCYFRQRKLPADGELSIAACNGSSVLKGTTREEAMQASTKTVHGRSKKSSKEKVKLYTQQDLVGLFMADGHSKKKAKKLAKFFRKKGVTMLVEDDKYNCSFCNHLLVDWPIAEGEEPDCLYCWDTGNELTEEEMDKRLLTLPPLEPETVTDEDVKKLEAIIDKHTQTP